MNGYNLSRRWFDWAFENPDINTPVHTALFMWVIEKWNRLGQKEKFGLPSSEAMEVLGIRSFNTYKRVFNNLVGWGFIELIQESKNQYTSTIIALSKSDKAIDKALDKALTTHIPEQSKSTRQLNEPLNKESVETEVPTTAVEVILDDVDKPINSTKLAEVSRSPNGQEPLSSFKERGWGEEAFQTIWDIYDKKIGDRQRCEKKWNTLSDKEKWLAWEHIPNYVRSTPDKKYRANLETYLNQKRWDNEIIHTYGKSNNRTTKAATVTAKLFLEKPRPVGGDPIRKNIFGKEEKPG